MRIYVPSLIDNSLEPKKMYWSGDEDNLDGLFYQNYKDLFFFENKIPHLYGKIIWVIIY